MRPYPDKIAVPAALLLVDHLRGGGKLTLDQALSVFEIAATAPTVAAALKDALAEKGNDHGQ